MAGSSAVLMSSALFLDSIYPVGSADFKRQWRVTIDVGIGIRWPFLLGNLSSSSVPAQNVQSLKPPKNLGVQG